jgi:diacylglycerol kinase
MEASAKDDTGKFTVRNFIGSFRNAFCGIFILLKSENNARVHVIILLLVIIAGLVLKISPAHWIAVSLAAGLVLASECLNTAIEYLGDVILPEYDPRIKKAKDVAAAGVLISAIAAVITGLIIFIPAIIRFFNA